MTESQCRIESDFHRSADELLRFAHSSHIYFILCRYGHELNEPGTPLNYIASAINSFAIYFRDTRKLQDKIANKTIISKGVAKYKRVKINDGKERRFVDIVTPFSSSNA